MIMSGNWLLDWLHIFPQDLPEGNYIDLKKKGMKEKANTLREMKVAFRYAGLLGQNVLSRRLLSPRQEASSQCQSLVLAAARCTS